MKKLITIILLAIFIVATKNIFNIWWDKNTETSSEKATKLYEERMKNDSSL